MDPNLLPSDLREKEDKEQARLKKQPDDFSIELNLPAGKGKSWKKEIASSGAKAPGLWSKVFGRPVSPVINYAVSEPNQALSPKIGQKALAPSLLKGNGAAARQPAGDSWSEIFKNMFGVGRKDRIDFRLASAGRSKTKTPAAPADWPEIKQPVFSEKQASDQARMAPPPAVKKIEKEKPKEPAKTVYHTVSKHEKNSGFNVNLMPQELLTRLSSGSVDNIKAAIIAVIVPLLIITLGYGAIVLLQNDLKARMAAKQMEFNDLQKQIGDFVSQEEKNNEVAGRVSAIKKLLDEKIIWSNFFSYLEKYTLDGVYFTDLTADTSGVLTLPGVADDYEVLAQQLAAFRDADDFISRVKLVNAQLVSEGKAGVVGVSFQLRVTLQDGVFDKIKKSD